jgi:hypothetical protein
MKRRLGPAKGYGVVRMALSQLLRDLNRNAHPDREPEVFSQ